LDGNVQIVLFARNAAAREQAEARLERKQRSLCAQPKNLISTPNAVHDEISENAAESKVSV